MSALPPGTCHACRAPFVRWTCSDSRYGPLYSCQTENCYARGSMINAASAGMAEPPLQRVKRELHPVEFIRTDWNASPLGVAPLGDYVPDERDRAEFVTLWDAGAIPLDRAAAFIAYGWLEQDGVKFAATAPGSLLLETHCPKCGEPLEPIEVLGLRDGEPTYAPSAMCINESCPSHVPTVTP